MKIIDHDERYSRQADLVPAEKLENAHVSIIGVGAIGRQIALQLAAMGVPEITLIDFDIVEDGNLAAQGFLETDLSLPKVEAVGALCQKINESVLLNLYNKKFDRSMDVGQITFCCVDDIETRRFIWNTLKDKVELFVDGRMSAEALRVIVSNNDLMKQHYSSTLFSIGEAFQGACTAKTTIYSSNVIAGIMVAQFAKHLRNFPLDADIQFNLLTNEITVIDDRDLRREASNAY